MELTHLNIEQALEKLDQNQKLYRIILEGFKKDYAHFEQKIRSLSLQGHLEDAERLSHSLKGLCGNLGAIPLQEYAKKLEFMYRSRSLEQEESILMLLSEELNAVVAEVFFYLEELNGGLSEVAVTRAYDQLEIKQHIQKLVETLESHQYGLINKAYQTFLTIQFSEKEQTLVDSVKNAVNSYEYVRAKEILKSLLYPS